MNFKGFVGRQGKPFVCQLPQMHDNHGKERLSLGIRNLDRPLVLLESLE